MNRYCQLSANTAFQNLKESDLKTISKTFERRWFPQDWPIVAQDRETDHIALIIEGSAEIVIRDSHGLKHICGFLKAGEFVIDISIFIGGKSFTSIISQEPTICLVQQPTDFLNMMEKHPALLEFFHHISMLNIAQTYRRFYGGDQFYENGTNASDRIPLNIKKSLAVIDQHYTTPLTLDHLARESGMSRYHLSRLFKHYTGTTFKEYLNHKRVEAAKNLMRHENMNVSEACFSVGYNDVSYFSRIFKTLEGIPPSTYRKNLKIETGTA